jgi:hypothetical protein
MIHEKIREKENGILQLFPEIYIETLATQLEMVAKMAKEESEQTTFIWWDGKQKKLSDFYKELGIEQPKMANKPNKKSG